MIGQPLSEVIRQAGARIAVQEAAAIERWLAELVAAGHPAADPTTHRLVRWQSKMTNEGLRSRVALVPQARPDGLPWEDVGHPKLQLITPIAWEDHL